ncbi:hypothetical protein LCGC14_0385050 [marine sediment metagenome]|uniref:Terminase small subunit n=1 Tax=marine sediment metagenome TaxID=412755 RepID=A0A0F9WA65_9ZZZZ
MLNQRQEDYAQLLYKGVKQIKAYEEAGFSINSTPETIAANASRLANSDKIVARLQELNAPMVEVLQSTKAKKLQILEKIYAHEPNSETITAQVTIKAVAEHNKMAGDYAPEKHAVLGDIEITIVHKDKGG